MKNDLQIQALFRKIMKLTLNQLIILLVLTGVSFAGISKAQEVLDTQLTLNIKNQPLKEVLKNIENKAEVKFAYSREAISSTDLVSVRATNEKLNEILDKLLKPRLINYQRIGGQIVLNEFFHFEEEKILLKTEIVQEIISGKVTSEAGEPIPGVNVVLKGTTIGTATDIDGNYNIIDAPEGGTLVFSFIGYIKQEVPINGRTTIDITLVEDAQRLEEVVVIGYGTQRRAEVTSSIATIKKEDFSKGAVYQSPLQLLAGKVAGVAVSRSRGGDPTAGIELQLRGVSSIRGDISPLVVIDGIPGGSLDAISPEIIESIDILRDGSAAAIYGTRANAGVIIITTKSGIPGKPEIAYSTYAYTERYLNKPDLLTGEEYRQYKNEWQNSDDAFWREKAGTMVDYGRNTDWFDVVSQNALSQVHDISMSGGSETTTYYGSFNYRNQNGLIKRTGQNVMSGRLSLTHSALDDRLVFDLNLSNSFRASTPFDGEIMAQGFFRNPTMPVYNKDRRPQDIAYNPDGIYYEETGYQNPNPLGLIEQFERDNESSVFQGNGRVSYELIEGLRASVMGAFQRSNGITGFYESRDSWRSWTSTQFQGVASRSSSLADTRTFEPTLNYAHIFAGVHGLTALAGYSYQDFANEGFSASNRNFLSDNFGYNNLGAGLHIQRGAFANPVSSNKQSSKLIAFFGRVNYSYDGNRFMFSSSLRREGSTRFGAENKWGYFPAVSAGWTISRERFMEDINFIDNMKLRIGYGITGNQGIPNYLSQSRLAPSGVMLYQGEWIPGYAPASNPNPNLRWEKKSETNIGIDLTIFENIFVNIDLYDRTTTDLLYEYAVPVPPNLFDTQWANVGEINNRGIEFSISANPVTTPAFSWRTDFNISYNRNLLVSLSNDFYEHQYLMLGMPSAGRFGLSSETIYRVEEGQPIGNIYTLEHAGITEDGKWQVWDEKNTNKIHPSNANFEDKRVTGNGLPKSWFGFNNTFTYRDFDLQISLRGALFFDILNAIHMHRATASRIPQNILKRGLEDPELKSIRDGRNYVDSYWVERGDYVKLDNLSLGYAIPLGVVKKFRVYVSGQNLFTLTQYKGEDPEQAIHGLIPAYDDYWNYPKVKTFTMGLDVTF